MSNIAQSLTVTVREARKAIVKCFSTKRPVFLWGPPGIGKSELVSSIADDLGGAFIDLRLAQMEPTDIRGIPFYNKELNKMDWAPPIDLPDEEFASQYPIVVLFLDELNSAAPSVQSTAYQLILNRRVGKYVLPDNVVLIAAGNRESDKGVTFRMPAPLSNRFVHIEVRPDFPSWEEWATKNKVHKDVVGYLSFAKQDLYDFDPKGSTRSFATPRSWFFVSELLKDEDCNHDELNVLISGTVGEGLAAKFMAHRKLSGRLPKPVDILEGRETDLNIKEISAMYSLAVGLCYELVESMEKFGKTDNKRWHEQVDNFFGYMMKNFTTETTVMAARAALTTHKLPIQPNKLKTFEEFHKKYGKYIMAAVGD